MRNGMIVEWKKIRHSNKLKVSLIGIFLFISLIVLKDIFINIRVSELGIGSWLTSINTILVFLIIPIISGIFYTFMINSEYTERTIVNYMSALVDRNIFIISKVIVWMFCHILMVLLVYIVSYLGSLILFPTKELAIRFCSFGIYFIKSTIYSFLSLSLLVPVSIFQRSSYIPSIVVSLGIVAIGISATQLSGILPFLLPWTATFILSQPIAIPSNLMILGNVIVIISSLLFYSLGLIIINKQDI